jgi:uncharacterized protein
VTEHLDARAERLAAALDDFIRSSPDVEAAAVVSFDGLPMASALPEDLEEDRVGAMSAALLSLGEQAALGLGRGQLNQVFVEGEHGFVFLMSARDQAVLSAIAARTAKIGFMLFEMRRAADRIGRALEAPVEPASPAYEDPAAASHEEPGSVHDGAPEAQPSEPAPERASVEADDGMGSSRTDLGDTNGSSAPMWDPARSPQPAGHLASLGLNRDEPEGSDAFGSLYGDGAEIPHASSDAWTV